MFWAVSIILAYGDMDGYINITEVCSAQQLLRKPNRYKIHSKWVTQVRICFTYSITLINFQLKLIYVQKYRALVSGSMDGKIAFFDVIRWEKQHTFEYHSYVRSN